MAIPLARLEDVNKVLIHNIWINRNIRKIISMVTYWRKLPRHKGFLLFICLYGACDPFLLLLIWTDMLFGFSNTALPNVKTLSQWWLSRLVFHIGLCMKTTIHICT